MSSYYTIGEAFYEIEYSILLSFRKGELTPKTKEIDIKSNFIWGEDEPIKLRMYEGKVVKGWHGERYFVSKCVILEPMFLYATLVFKKEPYDFTGSELDIASGRITLDVYFEDCEY